MAKASDNVFPKIIEAMQTTNPAAPSDSTWKIFAKADGIYARSSNATVGPFATSSGSLTFSGARVRRTTSIVGTGSTVTNITWDAESGGTPVCYDIANYHDNSTNPERLTVPANGYYEFGLYMNWASGEIASANSASVEIVLSSSKGSVNDAPAYSQFVGHGLTMTTGPVLLVSGDYATVTYLNDSGLDVSAGAQFWVKFLGS